MQTSFTNVSEPRTQLEDNSGNRKCLSKKESEKKKMNALNVEEKNFESSK